MITEAHVRATAAAQADLVKAAIALVRKHGPAISRGYFSPYSFSPVDDEAAALTIDGDVATLHYTDDSYDEPRADSVEFDVRCLWDRTVIARAVLAKRRKEAAERAAAAAHAEAVERARYEALRRKFEPTDLRSDIRQAIQVEARIAAEDAP